MALPKANKTRSWNRAAAKEAVESAELEGWEKGTEEEAADDGGREGGEREP